MKTKYFVVLSFLFFMVSFIITTPNLFGKEPGASCYFCMNDGTPDNYCAQSSGSGWTGCAKGFYHCGFYGTSCTS